jgi:hypothetical protein
MIAVASELSEIIAARIQRLNGEAPCQCGATALECRSDRTGDQSGPGSLCCWGGIPGHGHVVDRRKLATLHAEIAAGTVRTLEEAHPAPAQGPRRVTMAWLLDQGEIWQPERGPSVRIADMHICHRYHTVKFLERRAASLAFREVMGMASLAGTFFGPSGDMACDAFEREMDWKTDKPLEWLRSTELHRSLSRALPRGAKKLRRLVARAAHWSTCPRQDDITAPCGCPPSHDPIASYARLTSAES